MEEFCMISASVPCNRQFVARRVQEYDQRHHLTPIDEIKCVLRCPRNWKVNILEGNLSNMLIEIRTHVQLLGAISEHVQSQLLFAPVCALMITSPKRGSAGLGNSYGLYVKSTQKGKSLVEFHDTHARTDVCGAALGMVSVSIEFAEGGLLRALKQIVRWIFGYHIERSSIEAMFDVVSVSTFPPPVSMWALVPTALAFLDSTFPPPVSAWALDPMINPLQLVLHTETSGHMPLSLLHGVTPGRTPSSPQDNMLESDDNAMDVDEELYVVVISFLYLSNYVRTYYYYY